MQKLHGSTLRLAAAVTLAAAAMSASAAFAEGKYDVGASDTEIKMGHFNPYSGPVSAWGTVGKLQSAFWKKINEEGGINGRKINFISYDDAYSPPKAVEQSRRLVESDQVLGLFNPMGTASNLAIQKYMNGMKVPQIFVSSGAIAFGNPSVYPWTMGWLNYASEGRVYARYLLEQKPDAKVALFYQNDDFGKGFVNGFREALGDKAKTMIVGEASYEISEPTIDSQIVTLKATGADVLFNMSSPKFAAQAIRKLADLNWKPMHFLTSSSAQIGSTLGPAGLENSVGIISTNYYKDSTDPRWKDDPAMQNWNAFMDKYYPEGDKTDTTNVYAYLVSETIAQVLKQAGDDLTRENVMRQAANLQQFSTPLLLPGVTISTSATDYFPIEQLQLIQFNGHTWDFIGGVIDGSAE
ncbi:MAG: ABC transporter substrate-binding protein [Rhizobiales bacterium]|nr:ABC transporter substrate-binding protein [Hyphomicrobiales bacterium]OJU38467.1 MAG: branched-chain amino acid ABC transporter substrate-binding protein [Rhizobiales bacterium 68-8]